MNKAKKVIADHIGIQHAMAEYKNSQMIPGPDYVKSRVAFPVLADGDDEEYVKILQEAFLKVWRIETYDSRHFYRVSGPKEEYIKAFDLCAEEDLLNKWIKYFAVRGYADDADEQERIKLSPKQAIDMSDDAAWQEFIEYLKEGVMANAGRYGIAVPGFTLEELKNDPYVGSLAKEFDNPIIVIYNYDWKEDEIYYKSLELK